MTDNYIALATGTELNHYIIESVLGQGGFGVVYKAHHAHLNEQVVIKEFLPVELAGRQGNTVTPHGTSKQGLYADCLRRFMEEGRTLVKLRHPNVVRCRDLFTANGTAYLVMDFEDGLPLDELMRALEANGEHYSEQQLLHFLLPLTDGLSYIHQQGVLHRDIKPANVFIRRSDGSPVIIDFGAAKQNFAEVSQSQAPYTEFYAPLEQIEGGGEAKPTIDVYAFGGLMYRLVTGQIGPKAEARAMALVYGKADPLQPASTLASGRYSAGFLTTIDHCLAFNPSQRPQQMTDVRQGLQQDGAATAPASLSSLDDLIALAGADGEISQSEMQMLCNKGEMLGLSAAEVQRYVVAVARNNNWQLQAVANAEVYTAADAAADVTAEAVVREWKDKQSTKASQPAKGGNGLLWFSLICVAILGFAGYKYYDNQQSRQKLLQQADSKPTQPTGTTQTQQTDSRTTEAATYPLTIKVLPADNYTIKILNIQPKYQAGMQLEPGKYHVEISLDGHQHRQWVDLNSRTANPYIIDVSSAAGFQLTAAELRIKAQRDKAVRGDKNAQNDLGWAYQYGLDVEVNYAEALKWYRKAAEAGFSASQNNLAYMYDNGLGVTKNQSEAVVWYRKAADQGNTTAQTNLGIMYLYGTGVAKNEAEALRLFKLSAGQGDSGGQYFLGRMYDKGTGVQQDYSEAARWYKKAADQGYINAMNALGLIYDEGALGTVDDVTAVSWYRKAAEKNNATGQYNLALMYRNGEGVVKNQAEAIKWFRKSAQQGYEPAQSELTELNERW